MKNLTTEQQNILIAFVSNNFIATKSINQKHTAYGLKQRFDRKHFYITQEQFVQAMQDAGFSATTIGSNGNAVFNISERSPYFKTR